MTLSKVSAALVSGLLLASSVGTASANPVDNSHYRTVGLVTVEGPTGMFLNPTSRSSEAGTFKTQLCGTSLPRVDGNVAVYQLVATYAIADWFEVGGQWQSVSPDKDNHLNIGGPQARLRLLQESDVLPELSIGGYLKEGEDALSQRTAYTAASKFFDIENAGIINQVGLHTGFKYLWQDSDFNESNGAIGYLGAELGLVKNLHLVGEVSLKDDVYDRTPFSYGLQVRHPDGFGFSLAAIQTGFDSRPAVFIGVGINFLD